MIEPMAQSPTHLSNSPLDPLLPLPSPLDRRRLLPELLRRPSFPTTAPPYSSKSAATRLLPLPLRRHIDDFRCLFSPKETEESELDDRELGGEPSGEPAAREAPAATAAFKPAADEPVAGEFAEVPLVELPPPAPPLPRLALSPRVGEGRVAEPSEVEECCAGRAKSSMTASIPGASMSMSVVSPPTWPPSPPSVPRTDCSPPCEKDDELICCGGDNKENSFHSPPPPRRRTQLLLLL